MSILELPRYLINPAEMGRLQGEETSRRQEPRYAVESARRHCGEELPSRFILGKMGSALTLHCAILSVQEQQSAAISDLAVQWK